MGFKFLDKNIPEQPEMVQPDYNNRLHYGNRPAVFLNLNRNRDTISDEEWLHLLRQQRVLLIERMWEQGMILHEVISQDDNGLTLRTEINF